MVVKQAKCIAYSQWTNDDSRPCRRDSTSSSRLCGTHEHQLVRVIKSSSGFYRSRIMREQFIDLKDEDVKQVEETFKMRGIELTDSVNVRSNLERITGIIKIHQPISSTILTERINDFMGYRFTKKQVGKSLTGLVKKGVVKKTTTARRTDTGQTSEVIYTLE